MRRKNVFWGLVFLTGAAALLLSRLGFLRGVGFWAIVCNIFLASVLVKGIAKRSFEKMLFSLAFLIIVNDELLGLEAITPWPVLGAALLGSLGLNLLFPKSAKWGGHPAWGRGEGAEGRESVGRVFYKNTFGDATKYLSGVVGRVEAENAFGSMQIYFTETLLEGHRAQVEVQSSFGNTVLYVPAVWKVVTDVRVAFGKAEENGNCNPYGEDVLYVGGSVNFGNLEIVYVGEEECAGSEKAE